MKKLILLTAFISLLLTPAFSQTIGHFNTFISPNFIKGISSIDIRRLTIL